MKDPRMIFGFVLLLCTFALAIIIALGRVEQVTSFGLDVVLGNLTTMSGGWTVYMFTRDK